MPYNLYFILGPFRSILSLIPGTFCINEICFTVTNNDVVHWLNNRFLVFQVIVLHVFVSHFQSRPGTKGNCKLLFLFILIFVVCTRWYHQEMAPIWISRCFPRWTQFHSRMSSLHPPTLLSLAPSIPTPSAQPGPTVSGRFNRLRGFYHFGAESGGEADCVAERLRRFFQF